MPYIKIPTKVLVHRANGLPFYRTQIKRVFTPGQTNIQPLRFQDLTIKSLEEVDYATILEKLKSDFSDKLFTETFIALHEKQEEGKLLVNSKTNTLVALVITSGDKKIVHSPTIMNDRDIKTIQSFVQNKFGGDEENAVQKFQSFIELQKLHSSRAGLIPKKVPIEREGKRFEGIRWVKPEKGMTTPSGVRVPPKWQKVQIATSAKSGLQAIGIDSKGRRQYLYSAAFRNKQNLKKFSRLKAFSSKFPQIQARIMKDLPKIEEAEVLYLVMKTGFRIGSDKETLAAKKAYGASTLLRDHVEINGDTLHFHFPAKKGTVADKTIEDPVLARILAKKKQDRKQLFSVADNDVRSYLAHIGGAKFLIKDFRTYMGTSVAISTMKTMPKPTSEKELKKAKKAVAEKVASQLSNTPAVCLSSYIAPEVWANWEAGIATIAKTDLESGFQNVPDLVERVSYDEELPELDPNESEIDDEEPERYWDYEENGYLEKTDLEKHLQGQHDQSKHGNESKSNLPNASQELYDYQWMKLERPVKIIQRINTPNNAAEANVGFRLENAGDAFREIAKPNFSSEEYIEEKLDRIERSLSDSEWENPLSAEAQNALANLKKTILEAPVKTERHKAAQKMMVDIVDRNLDAIKKDIQIVRGAAKENFELEKSKVAYHEHEGLFEHPVAVKDHQKYFAEPGKTIEKPKNVEKVLAHIQSRGDRAFEVLTDAKLDHRHHWVAELLTGEDAMTPEEIIATTQWIIDNFYFQKTRDVGIKVEMGSDLIGDDYSIDSIPSAKDTIEKAVKDFPEKDIFQTTKIRLVSTLRGSKKYRGSKGTVPVAIHHLRGHRIEITPISLSAMSQFENDDSASFGADIKEKDAGIAILCHEFAHAFYFSGKIHDDDFAEAENSENIGGVTEYAKTSFVERFAESFAYARFRPDLLQQRDSFMYRWMEKHGYIKQEIKLLEKADSILPPGVRDLIIENDNELVEKIAEELRLSRDGGIIALVPLEEISKQLEIPNGIPWNEMHITLAYIKYPWNSDPAKIVEDLDAPKFEGRISGYERFEDALVALIDVPGLDNWRTQLTGKLIDAGFSLGDFYSFKPHITLAYLDKEQEYMVDYRSEVSEKFSKIPIIFKSIEVLNENDKKVIVALNKHDEDVLQKLQPPRPGLVPQTGDYEKPFRWVRPEEKKQDKLFQAKQIVSVLKDKMLKAVSNKEAIQLISTAFRQITQLGFSIEEITELIDPDGYAASKRAQQESTEREIGEKQQQLQQWEKLSLEARLEINEELLFQHAQEWGEHFFGEWQEGLIQGQLNALESYLDRDYRIINRDLRLGYVPKHVHAIDFALKKSIIKDPIIVYRGVTDSKLGEVIPGTEFVDDAYVSTSLMPQVAMRAGELNNEQASILYEIHLKSGTHAAYVSGLLPEAKEAEVLIQRGQRFKVLKVTKKILKDEDRETEREYTIVSTEVV